MTSEVAPLFPRPRRHRTLIFPELSESQLLAKIMREAEHLDLLQYHTYGGNVSRFGFPDLVIVGPRGHAIWEVKSTLGDLSPDQQDWADMLKAAGLSYSVIAPKDWESGEVRRRLLAIADPDCTDTRLAA